MKKILVGVPLLAVALTTSAGAQTLGSQFEIGAFGQFTKLDSKIQMDNVIAGGVRAGMSVYKWIGVEGDIQAGSTKATRNPFESITYRPFRGLATVTVPMTESRKASLILGGGYVNSIYAGRSTPNEYEDGLSGLVGLKLCGSGKWGARIDGLMDFNPSPNEQGIDGTSRNLGLRAGVTYALRGACGSAEPFDWALKIDPASATIERGANRQFALSAADLKGRPIELRKVMNLTCSSSDASVATVDNTGKVTAVKAGTATISCKGLVKKLERTATSTVTVPPPAWTLTLTPKSGSAEVGKTLAFTASAVDADKVDLGAISWSSANAAVASVNGGTVMCNAAGSTTITASKTAYGATKNETASVTCTQPPVASIALDRTQFDFDRAVVTKVGMDTLQSVLAALMRVPSLSISIEGHTDRYGSVAYNSKLAQSRAEAVRRQLMSLAGKDAKGLESRVLVKAFDEQCLLTTAGADETEPPPANRGRISTANKVAQADNRRVEIWQVMDGKGSPSSCRSAAERAARVPFTSLK